MGRSVRQAVSPLDRNGTFLFYELGSLFKGLGSLLSFTVLIGFILMIRTWTIILAL